MNRLKLYLILLVIGLPGFLFTSCKKDDSEKLSVSSVLTSGSWRVGFYFDKTKDETSDFAGYTFVFLQNGQMNISHASGSSTGTWAVTGSDDNGSSQRLILNAGTSDPLNSLNDDWVITSKTESRIELRDDSNSNEVLHFIKQ